MKKHLVMIVGSFYPDPSPTGKCAEAYIDLLSDHYDVSVICFSAASYETYTYNGKLVYPTADCYSKFQHNWKTKNMPRLLQNAAKVPVHLFHMFVHPNNLHGYAKKAQKLLEDIHTKHTVDVIFSVGAPMAAHVAAYHFHYKHPKIRWVTYTVDSYAGQNKDSRRYASALAYETKVLCASDQILLSEEIYKSTLALYQSFVNKCTPLPYLMPPTPQHTQRTQYFDPGKINLVYAGRFYKKIRNPEYLLQLALEMKDGYVLHLFCQSDCDGLIDDYVRRSKGKIVRHAPVSVEEIQKIYAEADVLVNVGNTTPEFMPSKTFEYIATGKPILNIYYEGLLDDVLKHNPLSLQIQRGTPISKGIQRLQTFVLAAQGKILQREEIERIYFKHSCKNIKAILEASIQG